ncbi:MAG: hypothetical protein KAS29_12165, partial [Bacteroidales bacterium]|nr:hypothetical protein [Bacteroidales bacterium]
MATRIILKVCCFVLSMSLFSQQFPERPGKRKNPQILFDHISTRDGLSDQEVISIFQDQYGYTWFGTLNGLNKFDGYSFESFFNDPADIHTISSNWIFDIAEDLNGILWIGTKGGLNKYDKLTGRFSRVRLSDTVASTEDNYVYGIAIDESHIYINHSSTLTVMDFNTEVIQSYKNSLETSGALYDKGFPVIKSIDGTIWIGSANGLCNFNPLEEEFRYFQSVQYSVNSISNGHITSLLEDKNGNILIGTEEGLYIYNPETEQVVHYKHNSKDTGSLSNNYIQSMIQDHTGNIWIGTDGGGLNRATGISLTGATEFTHFRNLADNDNFIGHDIVLSLFEDRSHNLWIGT